MITQHLQLDFHFPLSLYIKQSHDEIKYSAFYTVLSIIVCFFFRVREKKQKKSDYNRSPFLSFLFKIEKLLIKIKETHTYKSL